MTDSCYLSDAEIARRLHVSDDKWAMLRETAGFPPKDPIVKKRFWPSVEAWLFHRHGISDNMPPPVDGQEHWGYK